MHWQLRTTLIGAVWMLTAAAGCTRRPASAPGPAPATTSSSAAKASTSSWKGFARCRVDPTPCFEACRVSPSAATSAITCLIREDMKSPTPLEDQPSVPADPTVDVYERNKLVARFEKLRASVDAARDIDHKKLGADWHGRTDLDRVFRELHEARPTVASGKLDDDDLGVLEQKVDRLIAKVREIDDRVRAEAAEHAATIQTCDADGAKCKRECDAGKHIACVRWSEWEFRRNRTKATADRAKAMAETACGAGLETGCVAVLRVQRSWAARQAELSNLADPVAQAITKIAEIRYGARMARTFSPTPRNLRAAGRAEGHAAELVRDSYCPARAAFIEAAGQAGFTSWATTHCTESPPTSGSPSGEEVQLTTECRAVIASPCPAVPKAAPPVRQSGGCQESCVGACRDEAADDRAWNACFDDCMKTRCGGG